MINLRHLRDRIPLTPIQRIDKRIKGIVKPWLGSKLTEQTYNQIGHQLHVFLRMNEDVKEFTVEHCTFDDREIEIDFMLFGGTMKYGMRLRLN